MAGERRHAADDEDEHDAKRLHPRTRLRRFSRTTDTSTIQVQTTSNTSQDDNGGLGTMGDVAIYGAGALLLFGMGWLIVRDARRRAPIEERVPQPTGTHSPQRHARARAKAKAARAQRKRNRARR